VTGQICKTIHDVSPIFQIFPGTLISPERILSAMVSIMPPFEVSPEAWEALGPYLSRLAAMMTLHPAFPVLLPAENSPLRCTPVNPALCKDTPGLHRSKMFQSDMDAYLSTMSINCLA